MDNVTTDRGGNNVGSQNSDLANVNSNIKIRKLQEFKTNKQLRLELEREKTRKLRLELEQEWERERERFDEAARKSEAVKLALIQEKQRLQQGGNAMSEQQPPSTSNEVPASTKPKIRRLKPRVGKLKGDIPWTGGPNLRTERLTVPRSSKALRPQDSIGLKRTEALCTLGLVPSKRLGIANGCTTVTLVQWIDDVTKYMEDRGMDTVFRIYHHLQQDETYLFEKWNIPSKDNLINDWVIDLKKGIQLMAGRKSKCYYDLDNLNWSGTALKNSVTATLWKSISSSLPKNATGPEVFKAIIDKCTGITNDGILKSVENPICSNTSLFLSEGESKTPSSKSDKILDKPICPNIPIVPIFASE